MATFYTEVITILAEFGCLASRLSKFLRRRGAHQLTIGVNYPPRGSCRRLGGRDTGDRQRSAIAIYC